MLQASRPVAIVHRQQPYTAFIDTMPPKQSSYQAKPGSSSAASSTHPHTGANLRLQHQETQPQPSGGQFSNPAVGLVGPSVEGISGSGKIAIPKLRRDSDWNTGTDNGNKKRTSRACAECRARKIKCSGRQPTCDHCEQSQLPCVYVEGKREQNKKGLERGDRMLSLLKDIGSQVVLSPEMQEKILSLQTEADGEENVAESNQLPNALKRRLSTATVSDKRHKSSPLPEAGYEAEVSAEVGSQESVDLAHEDYNEDETTRATGFIGQNSEVMWAQRLAEEQSLGNDPSPEDQQFGPYGAPGESVSAREGRLSASKKRHTTQRANPGKISSFTYHLDDNDVLLLDCVEENELPTVETAKQHFNCYMATVHDIIPILSRTDFTEQFERYLESQDPEGLSKKWRAILNLVFAIGATFAHLIQADWCGDERDHRVYYTRAYTLGICPEAMVAHPDLQSVQILGMTAFYYLTISQINRAWVTIGIACRHAVALGLHLRMENNSLPLVVKEKRVRVWWSLYFIEHLLCEITGRPTSINHQFCSVRMPAPIDELSLVARSGQAKLERWDKMTDIWRAPVEDHELLFDNTSARKTNKSEDLSNSSSHFKHRLQLAILTQKIIVNLYSADTPIKSWETAQSDIVALQQEVDAWYTALPPQFQFGRNESPEHDRKRVILAFMFYSSKILLSRPCLCRIDLRVPKQGEKSKELNNRMARECVISARSVANLFPKGINSRWVYEKGPWWCIVHHIMQAMAVLMLELAFQVRHMAEPSLDKDAIIETAEKLAKWVVRMAEDGNGAAKSACKQLRVQFMGFRGTSNMDVSKLEQVIQKYWTNTEMVTDTGSRRQSQGPQQNPNMPWNFPADARTKEYSAQMQKSPSQYGRLMQTSGDAFMPQWNYQNAQTDRNAPGWPPEGPANTWQQELDASMYAPWPSLGSGENWNTMMWQNMFDTGNPFTTAPDVPIMGFAGEGSFVQSEMGFQPQTLAQSTQIMPQTMSQSTQMDMAPQSGQMDLPASTVPHSGRPGRGRGPQGRMTYEPPDIERHFGVDVDMMGTGESHAGYGAGEQAGPSAPHYPYYNTRSRSNQPMG